MCFPKIIKQTNVVYYYVLNKAKWSLFLKVINMFKNVSIKKFAVRRFMLCPAPYWRNKKITKKINNYEVISKYKNKKFIDEEGNKWDSKREYRFYLQLLENDKIKDIERQVEYILIPKQTNENGKFLYHPIKYRLDFKYYDNTDNKYHYVDVKGMRTPEYKIKKKLMYFIHKIIIEEK